MTQWAITLLAAAYGALANTKNQRCSDSSVDATNLMMIFILLSLLSSYLIIPKFIYFFTLITCLVDIVLMF